MLVYFDHHGYTVLSITCTGCSILTDVLILPSLNFYVSFWICSISPYIMYHTIYKSLFGKQESQESIQESRNQAKNLKIPESRRRKSRVADPSTNSHYHDDVWYQRFKYIAGIPATSKTFYIQRLGCRG